MQGDEPEPGLLHPRAGGVQEPQLPQRSVHHALVGQPLDLMHLATLGVQLAGLLGEKVVGVGK